MSEPHKIKTNRCLTLTSPDNQTPFIKGRTTVILDFGSKVLGRLTSIHFECLPTSEPQPILLENLQLEYLQRTIGRIRMAYLDTLVDPNPNLSDQESLDDAVQCLQGALHQHAAAAAAAAAEKGKGKDEVELTDLFEVLKIQDQSEHERMLENMIDGLKL